MRSLGKEPTEQRLFPSPTNDIRVKLQSRLVLTCVVLVGSLMLIGFSIPDAGSTPSTSPSTRTWFFHNEWTNTGWVYTMNESSPQVSTSDPSYGLGFFYFEQKGGPLYDQTRTGYNVTFALGPVYPYGFEMIPGTALVDLWTEGQGGNTFPSPNLSADFNLTLTGPTGQIIGTTLTTVILPVTNPPRAWNHTSVPLPIPRGMLLSSASHAYLNLTWINPVSGYDILMGFDSTPAHPASISVPANYYTSNLTIVSSAYSLRLTQSVNLTGSLSNSFNGSSVPGVTVTILAHPYADWQHPLLLSKVTTNQAGGYDFAWSPSDPALVGEYQVIASWTGNRYYSAESSQPVDVYVMKARTALSLMLSLPATPVGLSVTLSGSLYGLNGPIVGAAVFLSYNVQGTNTWTILTSSQTNSTGLYLAEWIPQATGNFTLKASWSGDAVQDPVDVEASLTSLVSPRTGTGAIWISSPTHAVGSSFNSTTRTLTFTLSPPVLAGTSMALYVPKTLVGNQPNGPLTIGGNSVSYSVKDAGSAWVISFRIPQNSSAGLLVAFGPMEVLPAANNSQQTLFYLLIAIPVAAAAIVSSHLLLRRVRKPSGKVSASSSSTLSS